MSSLSKIKITTLLFNEDSFRHFSGDHVERFCVFSHLERSRERIPGASQRLKNRFQQRKRTGKNFQSDTSFSVPILGSSNDPVTL